MDGTPDDLNGLSDAKHSKTAEQTSINDSQHESSRGASRRDQGESNSKHKDLETNDEITSQKYVVLMDSIVVSLHTDQEMDNEISNEEEEVTSQETDSETDSISDCQDVDMQESKDRNDWKTKFLKCFCFC